MSMDRLVPVFILILFVAFLAGAKCMDLSWENKTETDLISLTEQIKECEKNLPRSQYCVGEVKIIIKDKE